jgi:hypothetical protein
MTASDYVEDEKMNAQLAYLMFGLFFLALAVSPVAAGMVP